MAANYFIIRNAYFKRFLSLLEKKSCYCKLNILFSEDSSSKIISKILVEVRKDGRSQSNAFLCYYVTKFADKIS
jgi:hypothetical protein